ncbi:MAG: GNAT family N-acetyltransferase [Lutimonas sp.]
MKIFRSESLVDYSTYTFNYALYCLKESKSELPDIYDMGFLPYSNNPDLQEEIYYLARSLRVNLSEFKESSENRRVSKKIVEMNPDFEVLPIGNFDVNEARFVSFCMEFAEQRFSESISEERLKYILNNPSISHIFRFTLNADEAGYVVAIVENGALHYWFAFFSLDYQTYSLGKWMMFSVIKWAAENGLNHVYLGTCYGEKSLYKVRDFKGLSFFDGNQWNKDMKLLKQKCKSDKTFSGDVFKQDTDLFLEGLRSIS